MDYAPCALCLWAAYHLSPDRSDPFQLVPLTPRSHPASSGGHRPFLCGMFMRSSPSILGPPSQVKLKFQWSSDSIISYRMAPDLAPEEAPRIKPIAHLVPLGYAAES